MQWAVALGGGHSPGCSHVGRRDNDLAGGVEVGAECGCCEYTLDILPTPTCSSSVPLLPTSESPEAESVVVCPLTSLKTLLALLPLLPETLLLPSCWSHCPQTQGPRSNFPQPT